MNGYCTDPNCYSSQQARLETARARQDENAARSELAAARFNAASNVELIVMLRAKLAELSGQPVPVPKAAPEAVTDLLSAPMEEIAARHPGFAETHAAQQLVLAKWVLSQKAYAETAVELGLAAGLTREQVQDRYKDNLASVLANATKHGNDAVSNPVLKQYADKIIKGSR